MQITKLDHVNLRTRQLDVMVAWYRDMLGFTEAARPDFAFPGAWLAAGETVMVHLIAVEDPELVGSEVPLKLEHFAFRATGVAAFEARLTAAGEPFRRVDLAATRTAAFNVWDPDGNHIHVDFDLDG
ncbi:VOC family protein [Dinoroseobacter sp. S375]|uniref:VOC family protein n=1 Tax=Dinoroseobacter sp. S375 TaxID=3415136 RepID=UPI003C7E2944